MNIHTFFSKERTSEKDTKDTAQKKNNRNKCTECMIPLVNIGNARLNGRNHTDWDTRKMHKKCFIAYKNKKLRETLMAFSTFKTITNN